MPCFVGLLRSALSLVIFGPYKSVDWFGLLNRMLGNTFAAGKSNWLKGINPFVNGSNINAKTLFGLLGGNLKC